MRLVRPKEAAAELFISTGLVYHWVRTGRLAKHPYKVAACNRRKRDNLVKPNYYVDIEEARGLILDEEAAKIKLLHSDKNLLRPADVARITRYDVGTVYRWVKSFELTKYRIGKTTSYLLDGDEVADALEENGLAHLVR